MGDEGTQRSSNEGILEQTTFEHLDNSSVQQGLPSLLAGWWKVAQKGSLGGETARATVTVDAILQMSERSQCKHPLKENGSETPETRICSAVI